MKNVVVFLNCLCAILAYYKAFDDYLLPVIPSDVFGYLDWRRRIAFDVLYGSLFLLTAALWFFKKDLAPHEEDRSSS